MKTYTLPNGEERKTTDDFRGRYLEVFVQRIFKDEKDQKDNILMPEKYKGLKSVEHPRTLYKDDGSYRQATDTMLIAEDLTWIEYPPVKSYTSGRRNTKERTKFEVILQEGEWKRRLFIEFKGSRGNGLNFYEYVEDLASELLEDLEEGKHDALCTENCPPRLDFYNDDGERTPLEFENEWDITSRIVSLRVVEFESVEI